MRDRLRRTLSVAGHGAVLLVCLGLLGSWTVRVAQHLTRWAHAPAVPAFGAAEVVYFYEPGCPACLRARPFLDRLQQRHAHYRWARVDLSYPRGMELAEAYYLKGNVPVQSRGTIPTVFAGTRAFIGYNEIHDKLPAYLEHVRGFHPRLTSIAPPGQSALEGRQTLAGGETPGVGGPAADEGTPPGGPAGAAASIRARFASFRLAPVLLAGLVDSVNPCAIATLIFFLSYLAFTGRRPHELLGVGAAFTAGVFITYFLIGLGILRVLHTFTVTTTLARWVYPSTGLATMALAGVSFRDYLQSRRGRASAITLQMPRGLKRWAHQAIRTSMGPDRAQSGGRLAVAAFATAVVVSALEFTCTSQVYLPTLMYMTQVDGQRVRATWLLFLYNGVFVAPLVVLFLLSYLGASSRSLATFFVRQIALTKLAMSLLFAGFSVYMFAVGASVLR